MISKLIQITIDLFLFLPIVSKLIERVVFNQLYGFLMRHDLLADAQLGFRPCHSTLTALLDITNDWFSIMDNGLSKGVLFLYFKKAFDTVDHEILLRKLQFYGVDSIRLKWFQDFISSFQSHSRHRTRIY